MPARAARKPSAVSKLEKPTPGSSPIQPAPGSGSTATDPLRFDERDLHSAGGERIGRRTTSQSAADNGDVSHQLAAKARVRRSRGISGTDRPKTIAHTLSSSRTFYSAGPITPARDGRT